MQVTREEDEAEEERRDDARALFERAGAISRAARTWVCWLLAAGVVLFCGSLYLLALTGLRALGAVTPLGGLSFIAAWLLLAVALLRGR